MVSDLLCKLQVAGMDLQHLLETVPDLLRRVMLPHLSLTAFQACSSTSRLMRNLVRDARNTAWQQAALNSGLPEHHPLHHHPSVRQYLIDSGHIDRAIMAGTPQQRTWGNWFRTTVSHDLSRCAYLRCDCLYIMDVASGGQIRKFVLDFGAEDVRPGLKSQDRPGCRLAFSHDDSTVSVRYGDPSTDWDSGLLLCDLSSGAVTPFALEAVCACHVAPDWAPSRALFAYLQCSTQDVDSKHAVWHLHTVTPLAEHSVHAKARLSDSGFCWSPDSQHLAGAGSHGSDFFLQLVDLEAGVSTCKGSPEVQHCSFSPCSTMLLVCVEGATMILSLQAETLVSLERLGPLSLVDVWHAEWGLQAVALAVPAGSDAAGGFLFHDNAIRAMPLAPHTGVLSPFACWVCAWSPDGRHLLAAQECQARNGPASCTENNLMVLNLRSGHLFERDVGHPVDKVAWSPDGKAVLAYQNCPRYREHVLRQTVLWFCA